MPFLVEDLKNETPAPIDYEREGFDGPSPDNVVKPLLISRGSSLPFVLVFLGVFGGVIAFGFVGIFIGPTLLAVGLALAQRWTRPAAPPTLPEA